MKKAGNQSAPSIPDKPLPPPSPPRRCSKESSDGLIASIKTQVDEFREEAYGLFFQARMLKEKAAGLERAAFLLENKLREFQELD